MSGVWNEWALVGVSDRPEQQMNDKHDSCLARVAPPKTERVSRHLYVPEYAHYADAVQ